MIRKVRGLATSEGVDVDAAMRLKFICCVRIFWTGQRGHWKGSNVSRDQ